MANIYDQEGNVVYPHQWHYAKFDVPSGLHHWVITPAGENLYNMRQHSVRSSRRAKAILARVVMVLVITGVLLYLCRLNGIR